MSSGCKLVFGAAGLSPPRLSHCPLQAQSRTLLERMSLFQNGTHVFLSRNCTSVILGSLFGDEETDGSLGFDLQEQNELAEKSLQAQDTVSGANPSPGVDAIIAIAVLLVIFGSLAAILLCCSRVAGKK